MTDDLFICCSPLAVALSLVPRGGGVAIWPRSFADVTDGNGLTNSEIIVFMVVRVLGVKGKDIESNLDQFIRCNGKTRESAHSNIGTRPVEIWRFGIEVWFRVYTSFLAFPVEYNNDIINPSGATLASWGFFYTQKSKMAANLYIVKNYLFIFEYVTKHKKLDYNSVWPHAKFG